MNLEMETESDAKATYSKDGFYHTVKCSEATEAGIVAAVGVAPDTIVAATLAIAAATPVIERYKAYDLV